MSSVNHDDLAHLKIPLEIIRSATDNFAEKNIVCTTEFERRYMGQLFRSGELIGIEARRWRFQEEQRFWMNISMLSSLKHKNIVSLVGFCDENDEKIIIIKHERMGGLPIYLSDFELLTWVRRLEISVGIAHALSYIHYDEPRDFSVIHRHICSANVVLNDDWEPKLYFFDVSMKIEASQRYHSFHTNKLEYVNGYGDPTYIETKSVNHKSDMYSFGILLFELLCGRNSIIDSDSNKYLAPLVVAYYRDNRDKRLGEIIDWDLWKQMDSQSLGIFAETAYACLNEERLQRPNIGDIVMRLEKALELQLVHQKAIMSIEFAHLRVPLENIQSATSNFAIKNIVCTNESERRYMGQLFWSGELIGIEARRWRFQEEQRFIHYRRKPLYSKRKEEQRFWMNISMLSSLKHKNIVSLVGFCDENDEKIIIIKRERRGGLPVYLSDSVLLTWVRRLDICVGIAYALSYIHYDESHDFSIIHRHICSGNVVLNDDWEPKLYFFDCSMKIEASQRHHSFRTNKVEYANGYGDPTYIETKSVNHKSDMYSFGILLFELLCGRKSIIDSDSSKYLAPLALTHYREKKLNNLIDWDLWKQMDSQSFNMFAEIAYECLAEERSRRPNIDDIVPRLEKALELQLEHQKVIMSKEFPYLKVPFESIRTATNNFAEENIVCTTKFERRYWGKLLWSSELIGIEARRWRLQEEQRFWMDISMLSSLKHKNIVSLVGFCDENDEKIIIIKHEMRGGLGNYLSDSVRRLEICVSIAHALSYIHYDESHDFSIIHRHICSGNVVLNDDWEPKLYFFDFSMKIEVSQRHHSFHTNILEYVNGYGDPTYIETKSVNHKSDMYSFGILLFEILCGRKSIIDSVSNKFLALLALTHHREKRLHEMIDWDLWKQMDSQSFSIFADTAFDCLNEERSQRPYIDEIVTRLEKALELQLKHQKAIMSTEFAHFKAPLENIRSATNNFAEKNIVCTTEFETRYMGQLFRSGELIGIEARRWRFQEEERFWMEISMLYSLKHKNIVSLVGFCDENDEKIIIIKHEMRGGLGNYLSDSVLLTWVRRLEISVGIAHALRYIHYDKSNDFSVIHRHICSGNVVLNDDWEPKLYFFDFSMKIEASQRHHSFRTNKVEHSNGYGDPTYIETKIVNHKSDMYSFGILLFELLCGRKSIVNTDSDKYLAPLALTHYREKKLQSIIDWDLWKQMDSQSFDIFTETANECLAKERSERPDIDEIVTRLEKALELQKEHQKAIMPKEFAYLKVPFESIRTATNNFAEENIVCTTKFERRYRGKLLWSSELIGIEARRWRLQEEERFWMDISMLSSLKHKNLVSLVGFCDENDEKIIIMKRGIRGGLGNYLSDSVLLTWVRRLEICVGIAHALSYIHYDEPRDFSVIHRRLCSANVVLNDDWEPTLYLFDFSMKIEASQRHHSFRTNKVEHSNGYGDPTYIETKIVNHKSDMYSFGILLFELLCGRKSIVNTDSHKYLAPLALTHYREKKLENIIHQDLWKQMDAQSFNMVAEIAYDCLNEERSQRPNIDEIVTRLEKALELHLKRETYDNSILNGSSSFMHKKFQHLKIELQAIKSATNDFDDSYCIGKGGFGKVYKGELGHSKGQSVVALKRLDRAFGQGDPEFWKEIIMLSLYRHDNIVSLLGFCDDCDEKILVYDYASRRSLDLYLNDKNLMWVKRLEICIGAARGLAYLHNPGQTQQRVLHRDIKSSNILLDENWNARIADLGLSKFGPANQQYTFLVSNGVGTLGYCDPLYIETGLLTKESDVYSFGVVLFEMLCGRLCIRNKQDKRLTTLVRECYKQNTIADIVYGNIKDEINPHSLKAFTTIAYQCLNRDQEKRPLMAEVVKVLENALMYQVSNEPPTSSLPREPRIS